MRTKHCLKVFFRASVYTFVGVVCFCVTTIILNRYKRSVDSFELPFVSERDSCLFEISNKLSELRNKTDETIVYIETNACAMCTESAILNIIRIMHDSSAAKEPIMIYHPSEEIDSSVMKDYHNHFDNYFRVIISNEDSVMEKNQWLPKNLGIYGIVVDSLSRVRFAGSLFDPSFINYYLN